MKNILFLSLVSLLILACGGDDSSGGAVNPNPNNPNIVIKTTQPFNITKRTATSGGNISDDGGQLIIARGVCWDTVPDPTIMDNISQNGEGSGLFASNINNLRPDTKYYIRAYATNSIGTTYADQMVFTTVALEAFMQAKVIGSFDEEMYTENVINTIDNISGENYKYVDFEDWQNVAFSFYFQIRDSLIGNSNFEISTLIDNDPNFIICFTKRNGPGDYEFYPISNGNLIISTSNGNLEIDFTGGGENSSGDTLIVEQAKIFLKN